MDKNINIRDIPEPLYYRALALRGKLKAKNWEIFLEKIITEMEKHK